VRIENIRALDDEEPGMRDYEISFLRLVDKVTNGSTIRINETGTAVKYKPGVIVGGPIGGLTHECPPSRGIGYFLEGMLWLAPFSKAPFDLTLKGVTNNNVDASVDLLRVATIPLLRRFGVGGDADDILSSGGVELKIKKRGAPPLGGGEVRFTCPVAKELSPIDFIDEGQIKRIRGIAYSTKCNPQLASRAGEAVRGVVNTFLPDVYVYTDHYKGKDAGHSPGYGLAVVAETTTSALLTAELCTDGDGPATLPEDLGAKVGRLLCDEVARRGCVDTMHQWLCVGLMSLTPEDVSRVRMGALTPHTIATLRLLSDFFGVIFSIKPDDATHTLLLSCLGTGFKNTARETC
jgi:RNA 3'-terminal phosphate cyclase-like protein